MRWHGFTAALLMALVACGGGSSNGLQTGGPADSANPVADNASSPASPSDANVALLQVDAGPDGKGVNRLYTSVTVCKPGNAELCATIDHVLVDTGSVGLRLLASAVPAPLQLSAARNNNGNVLLGCANFLDGSFAWGPLALADVKLGGLTAANTAIQLVGHSDYDPFQTQCSAWGDPIITSSDLGANGILGVGMSRQDCGSACEVQGRRSAANGKYFSCANAACTSVAGASLAADKQLQQVVVRFPTDNNGFAIQIDSVPLGGANTARGKLIFGLGTRSNNQFPALQVLASTSQGYLSGSISSSASPTVNGNFAKTFLDTGSNGIFFDTNLPRCTYPNDSGFYCPLQEVLIQVLLVSTGGAQSRANVTVGNAAALFQARNAALPSLGGPLNASTYLDLGLPFFMAKQWLLVSTGWPLAASAPGL